MWQHAAEIHVRSLNPLAILMFPLVVVIYVFNVLCVIWVRADLGYGILIGVGLPSWIFST